MRRRTTSSHPGLDPGSSKKRSSFLWKEHSFHWIPAFAGMTKRGDKILARSFIFLIKFYQRTLSPDHSRLGKAHPFWGCRFHPSCSDYAIQTLQKRGFLLGIPRIIWRILRCNPWNKGGVDLPK